MAFQKLDDWMDNSKIMLTFMRLEKIDPASYFKHVVIIDAVTTTEDQRKLFVFLFKFLVVIFLKNSKQHLS